ncbi:MAG: helix-turn-helix transcriptional regulator [Treponema sp.]|nr:helix-turn-helix transcriptional regulator [Treponema sp.]MDE6246197.1 helix-turn-helix domain-containing protein [Treponemataceae bacterium]
MFRENLTKVMREKNLSVKELAYKTGIKYGVLNSYLDSRNSIPSITNGVKIAEALDTSAEYLVKGFPRKKCALCEIEHLFKKLQGLSSKKLKILNELVEILRTNDDF